MAVSSWLEIALIPDAQDAGVIGKAGIEDGAGGINDFENDLCTTGCLETALDTELFQMVIRMMNTGGIYQSEQNAIDEEGILDRIAGGAADIAHNSPFLAQQGVEERGLTSIGCTNDSHRDTMTDGIAGAEGVGERTERINYLIGQATQLVSVGKLQFLVVGEVEFEFEQRSQMKQAVAQIGYAAGHTTTQLTERQVFLGTRLRSYQVSHRLGSRQVHLTGEKGALGELARTSHTATGINQPSEHLLLDIETAVASYLHDIFSGIGMGGAKDGEQHLVEQLIATTNRAVQHRISRRLEKRASAHEERVDNSQGPGTTDAQDGYSALTIGCRYRTNRVHGFVLTKNDYKITLFFAYMQIFSYLCTIFDAN